MNAARRLFSSTSRVANTLVPAEASPSFISPESLPPVLCRLIQRRIAERPEGSTGALQVANPFLPSKPNGHFVPPSIPKRRQKQLLEMYPSHVLPPSPLNPLVASAPVRWVDGTEVQWVGEYELRESTSVYGTRKRMFKGTKAEREREGREKERAERLAGMEKRIADWKKTKQDTKDKLRPSLPF